MKVVHLVMILAAGALAANAQTKPKPAAAKATAVKSVETKTATAPADVPGIPHVDGVPQVAFSLKYIDTKIGEGAVAEPNKLYKVHYTGWLAADGKKFDSSFDHRKPVLDKDGKPELDKDGKPKEGEAQPIVFPQGFGRVIPGWDQGFAGMRIGGKRRIYIPWQLAYGAMGHPPTIPAKSDLIFDVELIDVTDMPKPPARPAPPAKSEAPAAKPAATAPDAKGAPAAPATKNAAPAAPAAKAASSATSVKDDAKTQATPSAPAGATGTAK